jgi:serine protease
VLGLSTLSLAFAAGQDSLSVQVTNVGGGMLDVTSVVAATETGGDWLEAQTVSAPSTTTNVTSILASVDRTGLADGVYAGSIEVQSSGGDATISVSLVVTTTPAQEDVDIFVLAVDAITFETRAQDEVNPTTLLAYGLTDLPAGDYLIVAGSDDDDDGFICGPGDRYCGLYPTLDQPLIVTVAAGEDLSGLDFAVSTQVIETTAAMSGRGYRLR